MQKKCFVFLTLFAFVSSSAVADDLLRINADIRYRWEYEDNFNQKFYGENPPKGDSSDSFLLQRIRFTFDFNPHKNVHISAGLQDSRAYDVALPDDAFYNSRLGLENNPNKDYWELFDTYLSGLENLSKRWPMMWRPTGVFSSFTTGFLRFSMKGINDDL